MKKLILLASVAMLAACDNKADDAVVADNMMADDTVMVDETAAAPATNVGSFTLTDEAGESVGTTVTNADGTYTNTDAAGATMSGTWQSPSDGKVCFDADGDAPEMCWTRGDTMDGKTKWTADDGRVVMVAPSAA